MSLFLSSSISNLLRPGWTFSKALAAWSTLLAARTSGLTTGCNTSASFNTSLSPAWIKHTCYLEFVGGHHLLQQRVELGRGHVAHFRLVRELRDQFRDFLGEGVAESAGHQLGLRHAVVREVEVTVFDNGILLNEL